MRVLTLGNDIVDLCAVEPPLHPRYRARVLTGRERSYITEFPLEFSTCWAAKEAAYKALKRLCRTRTFIPSQYEFMADGDQAQVQTPIGQLDCLVTRAKDYVHVICAEKSLRDRIQSWICVVNERPRTHGVQASMSEASQAVRALAVREVSRALAVPASECEIVSEWCGAVTTEYCGPSTIPWLRTAGRKTEHLLSFSHHGRFAACAFAPHSGGANKFVSAASALGAAI